MTKQKFVPRPPRSASTPELSKELGLPWIDLTLPGLPSDDLPCGRCGLVRRTILVNTVVTPQVPSGIERLCEYCRTPDYLARLA